MFNHALMGSLMRKAVDPEPTYALLLNHEENYNHNDNVPVWNDKSGNDAHAVQDTAANQPKWSESPNTFVNGAIQCAEGKVLAVHGDSIHNLFKDPGGIAFVVRRTGFSNYEHVVTKGSLSSPSPNEDYYNVTPDRGWRVLTAWETARRYRFLHYFHDESVLSVNLNSTITAGNGERMLLIINYEAKPGILPDIHIFGTGTAQGATSGNVTHTPNAEAQYVDDLASDSPLWIGNTYPPVTNAHFSRAFPGQIAYIKAKKGSYFTPQEIDDLKDLAKNTYQVVIPD